MTTRREHLAWCEERAIAYLDAGDLDGAFASFASDITKHLGTDDPKLTEFLALEGLRCIITDDTDGMRRLLTGFQ